MGKYNSKKVSNSYGEFDSITEWNYFNLLLEREKRGEIFNLTRQELFVLQDKFKLDSGESIRAITYSADFCYIENGVKVIVDTKGSEFNIDEKFKVKFKMLKNLHRDCKFEIVIKYNGEWFNIDDKEERKKYKAYKKSIKEEKAKKKPKTKSRKK